MFELIIFRFFPQILLYSIIFSFLCHAKRGYFDELDNPRMADILKKRRCSNALSAACRISQIPTSPCDKAMANAHEFAYTILCIYD